MKTLLTLPLLLLSLISFPSWSETENDLYYLDGIAYKKFTDVPFTGELEGWTNLISAMRMVKGSYKDGKREGPWVWYYEIGTPWRKGNYKRGAEEGEWISYFENGELRSREHYKNGKKDGTWVQYYKNGQLSQQGAYKNGSKEGVWVEYWSHGNLIKQFSGVFKDGVKISD